MAKGILQTYQQHARRGAIYYLNIAPKILSSFRFFGTERELKGQAKLQLVKLKKVRV